MKYVRLKENRHGEEEEKGNMGSTTGSREPFFFFIFGFFIQLSCLWCVRAIQKKRVLHGNNGPGDIFPRWRNGFLTQLTSLENKRKYNQATTIGFEKHR